MFDKKKKPSTQPTENGGINAGKGEGASRSRTETKNKVAKKKERKTIDKNIRASMPWMGVTMSGDLIEVQPTVFAKSYMITFPAPLDATNPDIRAMYEDIIDKGAPTAQITGYRKDGKFSYYVTFTAKADTPEGAGKTITAYANRYRQIFAAYGCEVRMADMSIGEQLELMHSILNAGHGKVSDKLGCSYTPEAAKKAHLTTKDLVAPSYLAQHRGCMEIDDGVFGIAFLNATTKRVNGDLFQKLEDYPNDYLYTIHVNRFDPAKALKVIEDEIQLYEKASRPKSRREQNEELVNKNKKKKSEEQVKYPNFENLAIKEAYTGIFKDAIAAEESVAQLTIEFVFYAKDETELLDSMQSIDTQEMRLHYKILTRDYYQKRMLGEILPLAICDGTLGRTYTLTSASLFYPFPMNGTFETEDVNAVSSSDDFYTAKQKAPVNSLKKTGTTEIHSTIQDTIPIYAVYMADGVFETSPGVFTRAYTFTDINYHTSTEQDQNDFLQKYASLLNRFDSSTRFQIVLNNKNVNIKRFKQDTLLPMKGDGLDVYRKEYNAIIMDKMTEGRNNISKECYLIVSAEAEDLESAKRIFNRLDPEITTSFKEIGGSTATVMTSEERLESLYDIYNIGHEGTFMSAPDISEGIVKTDDVQNAVSAGIAAKDLIAPSGINFRRDWVRIGDKYARVVYLENYPNSLSDKFLSELTGVNCNMLVSLNYTPVRQDKAVKMVRHQMLNINANVQDAQKQASKNGYSMDLLPYDLKVASEESNELLTDLTGRNQKLFYLTLTVMIMADSKAELETNTEVVLSTGRKYLCGFKKLPYQQEDALNATLPFCVNHLAANRTLTTNASVIFQPFDAQDITDRKGGMYYGQNATSHNLIILNRRNSMNANGWVLGTPGCVDRQTEFFNGREWKSLADYKEGEKVLQFHPDTGMADLVVPERYIKAPCEKMYHFVTARGIDMMLSPEHNVLYYSRNGCNRPTIYSAAKTMTAQELYEKQSIGQFYGKIKTDFNYDGSGIDLTDTEIKIMLAVIADGYFDANNAPSKRCVINVKKDRKKKELDKLFAEYPEAQLNIRDTHDGYLHYMFYAPRREKEFGAFWYQCNHRQLKLICENILKWDGQITESGTGEYFTSVKESADFVQFAFSACGYRAIIRMNDRTGQKYRTGGKEYIRISKEYTVSIAKATMVGMEWRNNEDEYNKKLTPTVCVPSDGMKYCFTVPTHALVLRRNGRIFTTRNSGKSFAAKSEMTNVLLNTDDDVLVIDPEREYGPLAKAYGGSIVRIAPGSRYHLNPLDMDKDYADDDNPITLKSDFMLSICESVLGGRYGLNPTQVALIDRCVNLIYRDYLEHGYDERYTPTLIDFQAILEAQPEHEARELALALEVYTKGSLDVFAHHSNVDINNRFVIYDIKDIGSKLREFGYLVVLNAVWNRVIKNRKLGKKTWIYIDEVYLLFTKDESTQFIRQIFSRCRKWGGAITAITQNVEPILQNTAATTMLSNSDFIMLLNQAPVDRDILASLLHISPTNASYLSNCPPGSGLFVLRGQSGGTGTIVLPFRSTMSKSIAPNIYRVQTSKPEEIMDEFK